MTLSTRTLLILLVSCLLLSTSMAETGLTVVNQNSTEHKVLYVVNDPNFYNTELSEVEIEAIKTAIETTSKADLDRGDVFFDITVTSFEVRAPSDNYIQFAGGYGGILVTIHAEQFITNIALTAYEPVEITSVLAQADFTSLGGSITVNSIVVMTVDDAGLKCYTACVGMIVMGAIAGFIIIVAFIVICAMVCCCCRSRYHGVSNTDREPTMEENDDDDLSDEKKKDKAVEGVEPVAEDEGKA
ncbi:hypothetical protein AGDE_16754 [Angomonas deanei]|uniref:Uncharacterized protein n=1 Tax=Angomonas deanei TaxID=59799 RepID=A0A7G2CLG5_9TRYP|nr:hypothetical protein AGDE_16754 [Angomonas deanei]CAD2220698.1 hypothetical protein, conserved [Angomonas deanei]|eukprot:EPY16279.1 hypothetical protein AGDE_16754 [Angomonas deanei]